MTLKLTYEGEIDRAQSGVQSQSQIKTSQVVFRIPECKISEINELPMMWSHGDVPWAEVMVLSDQTLRGNGHQASHDGPFHFVQNGFRQTETMSAKVSREKPAIPRHDGVVVDHASITILKSRQELCRNFDRMVRFTCFRMDANPREAYRYRDR